MADDGDARSGREAVVADRRHQRGSALHPEGTNLPMRVPGAHLHPLLRRPPSGTGPSSRVGGPA